MPDLDPTLLVFWHTDPDKTQHHRGFGSPDGMASIRDADTHLGQVVAALDARGRLGETVIAVASDHGYVTISPQLEADGPDGPFMSAGLGGRPGGRRDRAGAERRLALRQRPERRPRAAGTDRRGAGGLGARRAGPVEARQSYPPCDGAPLPGTLPLEAVGIAGDLSPDIVCALAWDDTVNEYGLAGRSAGLDNGLDASHGGIS